LNETPTVLDVKGLKCPLPVLRANKAIRPLAAGAVLEIHATDPGTVEDFKAYCETTGHELVESREEEGVYSFVIRKSA
jgi:tRNA 2-thiouridine synthesizing protein A